MVEPSPSSVLLPVKSYRGRPSLDCSCGRKPSCSESPTRTLSTLTLPFQLLTHKEFRLAIRRECSREQARLCELLWLASPRLPTSRRGPQPSFWIRFPVNNHSLRATS